jgi:Contractile injection system tube protein
MDAIPKPTKCIIQNLDDTSKQVVAYFNPKELSIDKKVPWNKHKSTKANNPELEFTDAEPKDLSVELLFDTYETREDVHELYIKDLESFTMIIDDEKMRRPPMCIFVWSKVFPAFKGVITQLSTKYTTFLPDGTPVRATVSLQMKQADKLVAAAKDKKKPPKPKGAVTDFTGRGHVVTEGDENRADRLDPDHRGALDDAGSENGRLKKGDTVIARKR